MATDSHNNIFIITISSSCKRCKAKVVNGLNCVLCDSHFHPSCAKLFSHIIFLDNNMIQCCMSNNDFPGVSMPESSNEPMVLINSKNLIENVVFNMFCE